MESGESEYVELVLRTANELIEKNGLSDEMQISDAIVVHQNGQQWVEVCCILGSPSKANIYRFKVQFYAEESKPLLHTEIESGIEDCRRTYQNLG